MSENVVTFPRKKPVAMDDLIAALQKDRENFSTMFCIGLTKEGQLYIAHMPFKDEDLIFFSKVLDVYCNQVVEEMIEGSLVSYPEAGS